MFEVSTGLPPISEIVNRTFSFPSKFTLGNKFFLTMNYSGREEKIPLGIRSTVKSIDKYKGRM